MHPAPSIILFTSLSGAGLGLAAITGLGLLGGGPAMAGGVLAAIALAGAGLAASVFHLRRPDRAWRALSQWRSSWLSREGILAPAALALLAVYGAAGWRFGTPPPLVGILCAAASALAVLATGMIYAQLRAVPAWHGPLTPVCFGLYSAAGGGLLAAFVLASAGTPSPAMTAFAILATATAWAAQLIWWRRCDRIGAGGSTVATATGLAGADGLRQLEPPHTGANYLTREMGYRVARRHAAKLRMLAAAIGGAAPCALSAAAATAAPATMLGAAAACHLAGVAVARWLFFAQAFHLSSLYYQGAGESRAG